MKNLILPDYLTKKQKSDIKRAIKDNIPIIVKGKQGVTGKTTLVNMLKEQGIVAFELWECQEIELNEPLKVRCQNDRNKRNIRIFAR